LRGVYASKKLVPGLFLGIQFPNIYNPCRLQICTNGGCIKIKILCYQFSSSCTPCWDMPEPIAICKYRCRGGRRRIGTQYTPITFLTLLYHSLLTTTSSSLNYNDDIYFYTIISAGASTVTFRWTLQQTVWWCFVVSISLGFSSPLSRTWKINSIAVYVIDKILYNLFLGIPVSRYYRQQRSRFLSNHLFLSKLCFYSVFTHSFSIFSPSTHTLSLLLWQHYRYFLFQIFTLPLAYFQDVLFTQFLDPLPFRRPLHYSFTHRFSTLPTFFPTLSDVFNWTMSYYQYWPLKLHIL